MTVPSEGIPTSVQSLIFENIGSVEQLEIIMLLRAQPEHWFTEQELARKLRSSDSSVKLSLQSLCSHNLIQCGKDGTYAYAPSSEEKEALIDELQQLYRVRRTRIIQAIYNKP